MKQVLYILFVLAVFSACNGVSNEASKNEMNVHFNVSFEQAANHYVNVQMQCMNVSDDFVDFKMPVWTPGYYKIQDLSKHVTHFKANNGSGDPLPFYKTDKNTWRVESAGESAVNIQYQVYAHQMSVVAPYVDEVMAFLSPTGIFMFPDGFIDAGSTVTFEPKKDWTNISTGLDIVAEEPFTYKASNFDQLFDCPVLLGNQKDTMFMVKDLPHTFAYQAYDTKDKKAFISDLQSIIETASDMMGDIPYPHYTFMVVPSPGGGLEHFNSTALSKKNSVADTSDYEDYLDWLSFVTHEYFHLYNVKTIRPIALGPFDYNKENYTNMLWVSEGFTVYYEYLILNRAGIITQEQVFKYLTSCIAADENAPGHKAESVTSSSFDAWIHFFSTEDDPNNSISYYTKGCALGLLLDLKIREASNNTQSLDAVMRELYQHYYKTLQRGFTDQEFQDLCEEKAGCSLQEIFDYAQTVKPINYQKYLKFAGLSIDTVAQNTSDEVYLGAEIVQQENKFYIKNVERDSPAWNAGLGNGGEIHAIDGKKTTQALVDELLKEKKTGDKVLVSVLLNGEEREHQITLKAKSYPTFKIYKQSQTTKKQQELLHSWLN